MFNPADKQTHQLLLRTSFVLYIDPTNSKRVMTIEYFPISMLLCAAIVSIPVYTISTVYVKPNKDCLSQCPGEPCNPLSYYEQRVHQYFVSDTTMVFLNCTHHLKEALQPLIIKDIENFVMVGSGGFTLGLENLLEASSKIECVGTHLSGFKFINVTGIHIENLTFVSCGQEVVYKVRAALAFDVAYNVNLSRVTVRNNFGFGLHADRVFGSVRVYKSAFLHNTGNKEYYGGNARFWYGECPGNHNTYLEIESSYFLHGNDTSKKPHLYYPSATGLTLLIYCPAITVSINNITMVGNHADNGGNLAINFTDFTSNYHEVPSVVVNNSRIIAGTGYRGGGLRVWAVIVAAIKEENSCNQTLSEHCVLLISNTQFVENHAHYGGGLYISFYRTDQSFDYMTRQISLQNCTFSGNTIPPSGKGAAMEVIKYKILGFIPHVSPQFEIIFGNCSFSNNSLLRDKNDTFIGATVDIYSMERVTFRDCNFTKNNNTALSLVDSNLVLEGNILFDGNRAINGGALRFCDTSLVYIENNTHIKFYNNHAKNAGGAIYAQQQCLETAPPCFFQPVVKDLNVSDLKKWMSLTFVNNTANYAGSVLYGGTVDYCYTYLLFKYLGRTSYYHSKVIFKTIFYFTEQRGDSHVSSDPYGVCLCDGSDHFDCRIKKYTFPRSVYPGEAFEVSAVAVGQMSGAAPAAIVATVISGPNQSLSETVKQKPNDGKRCVTLTYAIRSKKQHETLELHVQQSRPDAGSFYYDYHPPKITVSLLPCPWGFTFQHDPPYCDCDPLLVRHKISCNISNHTIQRRAPMWIGSYNMDLNSSHSGLELMTMCTTVEERDQGACQGVVIHRHCPYDYCKLKNINISVNSTDEQCAFNRTGMLCGKCGTTDHVRLSLILGSSKCLSCSNLYLPLLIVFVLAGLALVIFLIVCNITVSEGMINGVVYYANIVHINRSIFFPSTEANPLAVFIAWLNLDLGIETCFYDGMDAYAKAWLQFVFPIYIWLIAGLIILLSSRYTIVARLSGRNAVKVLATLFLLSVAKLGRAIITSLTYTVIHYPDGSHVSVWLPDGNVKFLQGKHIPLFITAVAFWALILIVLLVLTFIPCLQKKSDAPLLCWVNKLKPLFDAYTGPYKDRYRFWPGLLLFLLSILFLLFALSKLDSPNAKLMLTAIGCFFVFTLAWVFRGIYRKWPLDIIESSCVLNLGLLAVVTNYILNDGNSQNAQLAVVNVSVGTVFVLFIVVLGYQAYKRLNSSVFWQWCVSSLSIPKSESQQSLGEPVVNQTDAPTPDLQPQSTSTLTEHLLTSAKYREPVFEYEDRNT